MSQAPSIRREEARPVSREDILAIADANPLAGLDFAELNDGDGGDFGEVLNHGDRLPGMPEGVTTSFSIPREAGDGLLSDLAPNDLGPRANHEYVIIYD
ncbi:MAG: hypothetical protein RLZZ200_2916, partial [Pseudomonadota bacterium]